MTIWRGTSEWTVPNRAGEWIRLGEYNFPPAVVWEFHGDETEPDLSARYEIHDRRPVCVSVRVDAKSGGRPIRTSDIQALAVDQMLLAGFVYFATRTYTYPNGSTSTVPADIDNERVFWQIVNDVDTAVKAGRTRGPSDAELARVAEVYRDADSDPTSAVLTTLGYTSRRTAARRVKQAEEAGLLPPATARGKRRGQD